jgi:serine/threonine protein kinase
MTSDSSARVVGGRYRLDRSIGSGGMGTVWQGTDELLGREVAVKEVRFPPEVGEKEQAELRERTLREARATARLSHPNVVTTYDVVEDDGRPYIVMELLPSRSLSTVLREDGALPPHRVAEIGLGLLGALESSHAQGVLHRDVKPGNVLLTPDGRPVLTDFGIATMAGDPALTSTGVVLGSPAYM